MAKDNKLIHQITSGLAGWLTFEQMRKGVDNLDEADLAKPLEVIARGRGFEAKREFPIQRRKKEGDYPRIDFLLVHRKDELVVALEMKYKADQRMAGGIGIDAERLAGLTRDVINKHIRAGLGGMIKEPVDDYELVKAVLFVWRENSIAAQMTTEPNLIRRQFNNLVKRGLPGRKANKEKRRRAMLGKIAVMPVACKLGSLRGGSTVTAVRFWVASLIFQESWGQLGREDE
jgi:hypothetical protein